jgi:hypothetical protein
MFFNFDVQADKPSLLAFQLTPRNVEPPVPVDDFEVSYTDTPFEEMTGAELWNLPKGSTMLFDAEFYENYSMIAFKSFSNGKIVTFDQTDQDQSNWDLLKLGWVMENFTIVGYNSRDYDVPMVRCALQGFRPKTLKGISNWIIFDLVRPYEVEKKYNLVPVSWNHVDLIEVAPLRGSLKLYAGRLHCRRMQDLPYAPDAILKPEEITKLKRYCINDLDNTELLMNELAQQIELRTAMSNEYGIDLRSKSDAQIAEYVIASELTKLNGKKPERPEIPPGKKYYYTPPAFIAYQSPVLQQMLATVKATTLEIGPDGRIGLPDSIAKLKIQLGDCIYKMGIGGLHSSEKSVSHVAGTTHLICDNDVASYYPYIILNNKLFPKHLGEAFLKVYRTIVERRIAAKNESTRLKEIGEHTTAKAWEVIANSLKITINGTFGKLGNRWSAIYAPDLLIQVTITGQLCLLMLIDMIEAAGIRVISANTDGVMSMPTIEQKATLDAVIKQWEAITGFTTEESQYKAVHSRDVNNYIAVPTDAKKPLKVKGAYSEKGSAGNSPLSRNPQCFVSIDAAIAYLTSGTPVEESIKAQQDIRKFVTVRNVKGGAVKSGHYVGKTIRWYYSTEMKGRIEYNLSGNKVPSSDGARPLMEMTGEMPTDVDLSRYSAIAEQILMDVGAKPKPVKKRGQNAGDAPFLFEFAEDTA